MIELPKEYSHIEACLLDGSMTGQQASDARHAARTKLGPPWQWKSWKTARNQIIGDCCSKCGAGRDKILTLQHIVKLPSLRDRVEQVKFASDYFDTLQAKKQEVEEAASPQRRKCCPKCESTAIVYRKRAATWICNGKTNKRSCKHVFEEPAETLALTPQQKRDISEQKLAAWQKLKNERKDDWLREGILLWIQDMRRYLSLKDTKTLCKRCAFMEDKTTHEPCSSCGHGFERHQEICPKCSAPRENHSSYLADLNRRYFEMFGKYPEDPQSSSSNQS